MIPGVIPDRTKASTDQAMAVAHDVLHPMPNTQVCISLFTVEEGLRVASEIYGPDGVVALRVRAAQVGGDDPTIVFAYRAPHHCGETTATGEVVTMFGRDIPAPDGVSFICTLPFAHAGDHVAEINADGLNVAPARWSQ